MSSLILLSPVFESMPNFIDGESSLFASVLQGRKKKKVTISDDFSHLVAGKDQISNFLEGYELVVELWLYMNRRDD